MCVGGIASNLMAAGSKGCFCTRGQVHVSLVSWPSFAITEGTWMACSGDPRRLVQSWGVGNTFVN